MKIRIAIILTGMLLIPTLLETNSAIFSEQNNINHINYKYESENFSVLQTNKEGSSCNVDGCGFSRNKTGCSITCSETQTAKCSCNCIKTTTFGTCLELKESCKCE